jgi:hypothetical protein
MGVLTPARGGGICVCIWESPLMSEVRRVKCIIR